MTTYQWLGVQQVLHFLLLLVAPAAMVAGLVMLGFPVQLTWQSYLGAGCVLSAVWLWTKKE